MAAVYPAGRIASRHFLASSVHTPPPTRSRQAAPSPRCKTWDVGAAGEQAAGWAGTPPAVGRLLPRTRESLHCAVEALVVVDDQHCCGSDVVVVVAVGGGDVVVECTAKPPQSVAAGRDDSCCCKPPRSPSVDALRCCDETQTWIVHRPQASASLEAFCAGLVPAQDIPGDLHSDVAQESAPE